MKKKTYDQTFKEQAVNLWLTSGKSAREVADELGIKPDRLYNWKEAMGPISPQPGVKPKPRTAGELEQELARVRRENEALREQRDILKKTLGILSEPPSSATNGSKR